MVLSVLVTFVSKSDQKGILIIHLYLFYQFDTYVIHKSKIITGYANLYNQTKMLYIRLTICYIYDQEKVTWKSRKYGTDTCRSCFLFWIFRNRWLCTSLILSLEHALICVIRYKTWNKWLWYEHKMEVWWPNSVEWLRVFLFD